MEYLWDVSMILVHLLFRFDMRENPLGKLPKTYLVIGHVRFFILSFSYLASMRSIYILFGVISFGMTNQLLAQETDHAQGAYKFLENKGQWRNE